MVRAEKTRFKPRFTENAQPCKNSFPEKWHNKVNIFIVRIPLTALVWDEGLSYGHTKIVYLLMFCSNQILGTLAK